MSSKNNDLKTNEISTIGSPKVKDFDFVLADQIINALWFQDPNDKAVVEQQMRGAVKTLKALAPRDEIEGMLIAQMIAAHSATMECFRRAMICEQSFEGRRENLTQANKLSRTYSTLTEALNRHRGKGQQKMVVEHVHVHAGGQAIVGPVGDVAKKLEDQPHAQQISNAPSVAMQSTIKTQSETLPSSSGQRPPRLPHAWSGRWCAKGQ